MEMPPGAQMKIGPYHLTNQTFDSTPEANYTSEKATIAVDRDGKQVIMLYPERRFYPVEPGIGHHGGDLFDAQGRSVRRVRRPQPGHATSP